MKKILGFIISLILAAPLCAQDARAIKDEPTPESPSGKKEAPTEKDKSAIKVEPAGAAVISASPNHFSTPGRKWITRSFIITNASGEDFKVAGYSADVLIYKVYLKKAPTEEWYDQDPSPYCGTGIELQTLPAGKLFTVGATLPIEFAETEFRFQFTRIIGPPREQNRVLIKTPPLRMK